MAWRIPRNVIVTGYVAFFISSKVACLAADWPQFRGSPEHHASSDLPDGYILAPLWAAALPLVSVNNVTQSPSVTSSPAVVGNTVYVGSENSHFYALDAHTGATIWDYAAGSPIDSSPLVVGGTVYFTPSNGHLTALDAASGTLVWASTAGGAQDRSSPNISQGNIVCGASYPKHAIYAVPLMSVNTATPVWQYSTDQFVHSSPAVDPWTGNIFCGANDGRVYALKPDGTPLWPAPFQTIGGIFRMSPATGNGKVYFSGNDFDWALHAVDAVSGHETWSAPMTPTPTLPSSSYRAIQVSSPAVDGDFVSIVGGYGKSSMGPSILYGFRDLGSTFQQLWTVPLPNSVSTSYVSSPAVTATTVLVGMADTDAAAPYGRLYSVNRATGAPQWYAPGGPPPGGGLHVSGGPILSSPAVSGSLVVIGDTTGVVTAYQAVPAGDVDGDGITTALDAVNLANFSSGSGAAPRVDLDRADVYPLTPRADRTRSFGDNKITPGDVARILNRAVGLEPVIP